MIFDSRHCTNAASDGSTDATLNLPAPLLAASKAAWASSLFGITATPFHQDVSACLAQVGVPNTIRPSGAGVPVIDVCVDLPEKPVLLMLEGAEMLTSNAPHMALRSAGLSKQLLEAQGYAVLGCSMSEWQLFGGNVVERGAALCAHLGSYLDNLIGNILKHAHVSAGPLGLPTATQAMHAHAASAAANASFVLPDSICDGDDAHEPGAWYYQAAAGPLASALFGSHVLPSFVSSLPASASSPSNGSSRSEDVEPLLSESDIAEMERTVQFAIS